jgi:hypothetical protein
MAIQLNIPPRYAHAVQPQYKGGAAMTSAMPRYKGGAAVASATPRYKGGAVVIQKWAVVMLL